MAFSGTSALVSSVSATSITTTVPPESTTGPITVTTPLGSATSAQPFTVLNAPPTLTPIGAQTVALGATLTFTVDAIDPEGDLVTLAVTPLPLPAHAAFNAESGAFVFTPDASQVGTVSLTFVASDGATSSSETITLTVTGAPAGGVTGVTGRVTDGANPIANVTVRLKATGQSTLTNGQGLFTLTALPAGRQQLLVDGRTAGDLAMLVVPVDLIADVTTHLASDITLPAVDAANAVPINPAGANSPSEKMECI